MVEVYDLHLVRLQVPHFNVVSLFMLENPVRSYETWSEFVVNLMDLYKNISRDYQFLRSDAQQMSDQFFLWLGDILM